MGVEKGREGAEGLPPVELNTITLAVCAEPFPVGAVDSDTGVEGSCQEVGVVGRSEGHDAEAALGFKFRREESASRSLSKVGPLLPRHVARKGNESFGAMEGEVNVVVTEEVRVEVVVVAAEEVIVRVHAAGWEPGDK